MEWVLYLLTLLGGAVGLAVVSKVTGIRTEGWRGWVYDCYLILWGVFLASVKVPW